MIGNLLRHLFHPHGKHPPPPSVRLTTEAEKRRLEERQREITARMERLRLEAERPALRHREGYRHE
jgi:hypothetical protein